MEIRIGDEELGSAGVNDVAVIKMDIKKRTEELVSPEL